MTEREVLPRRAKIVAKVFLTTATAGFAVSGEVNNKPGHTIAAVITGATVLLSGALDLIEKKSLENNVNESQFRRRRPVRKRII